MSDELSVSYPVKDLLEKMDKKLEGVVRILDRHDDELAELRREKARKRRVRVDAREIIVAACTIIAASGTAFGAVHFH